MSLSAPEPAAERRETTPSADDVLALEHFLPYRLSVLTNVVSRAIARDYGQRFGLTIPQWRVMAVLGRFPGLSANEVAERTEMDKVRVSRAVTALVKDGRVDRRADPDDRRRSVLRLSEAGRGIYAQIVPLARAYESRLTSVLSAEEWRALDVIIDKLTAAGRSLGRSPGSIGPRD